MDRNLTTDQILFTNWMIRNPHGHVSIWFPLPRGAPKIQIASYGGGNLTPLPKEKIPVSMVMALCQEGILYPDPQYGFTESGLEIIGYNLTVKVSERYLKFVINRARGVK